MADSVAISVPTLSRKLHHVLKMSTFIGLKPIIKFFLIDLLNAFVIKFYINVISSWFT